MPFWFSDQTRLFLLVFGCVILWCAESLAPLYVYSKNRLYRAAPNIALAVILVLTNLGLSFAVVSVSNFVTEREMGLFFLLPQLPWLPALLGILALDLGAYFAHVLLHKSWLGWQFHRVHHSDEEVNVTTAFRQHPGETVWRILWQLIPVAIFGIPLWVVVVYLMISTLNAQLEHTNIRLIEPLDRALRLVFVTTNMHKIHHSREQIETDTNYSNIFSIWDRVFGTFTPNVLFDRLKYGLEGFDEKKKQTLQSLLVLPFMS